MKTEPEAFAMPGEPDEVPDEVWDLDQPATNHRGWLSLAVALAFGAVVGLLWFGHAPPPTEAVVVARQSLNAGQRVVAADLAVVSLPIGPGHGRTLIPGTLVGLLSGQYAQQFVPIGAPVRVGVLHPGKPKYLPGNASNSSMCMPAT